MKTRKSTETQINATFNIGYRTDQNDTLRVNLQQISKTAYYLDTLFESIKTSILAFSVVEDEGVESRFNQLQGMIEHLQNISEIGSGFTSNLLELTDYFDLEFSQTTKPKSLAEQISNLLKNPALPTPIYDGLQNGLVDAFNAYIDQAELNAEQIETEYIEKVLRGYQKKQAEFGEQRNG